MTEEEAKRQAILAIVEALVCFNLQQLGEISELLLNYSRRKVAEREGREHKPTLEIVQPLTKEEETTCP